MESGPSSKSATATRIRNVGKRPDSMKLELLGGGAQKLVDNQVHLGFRKISYSVREGVFKNRNRRLLREINGDFYAGELTAIMGPSGAGKSTLMNILAGYTTRDVSGKLLVNEEHREENTFRKKSCYIMQHDNLQPLLTVMEAMTIAANLKISSDINSKEKKSQIEEILKALALWDCRKVRTESLSGGQTKRLAIALELLKNPQVMFFDEPTSGLDSVSTKQCIMLLKQLAIEGKTVICTIHQPSASVFEMFDHLYAIADGCCIYQGSIKGVIPYLEEAGLQCPSYHNPADYLLEVANGEYGPLVDHLMGMSQNGLSTDWRKRHRDTQVQAFDHIDQMMKSGILDPIKVPNLHYTVVPSDVTDSHPIFDSEYSTSFCNQLYVLIKRTFLILSRDRTLTYSRLATHTMIALIIGVLYYRIGEDASNVLNNFNYMAFSTMFLMFTAFNCVVTTFPSEMPIIVREHFNRWYSLKAYYVAITLADIPIQMVATILYGLITYFLTFQPFEGHRVALFVVMCMLISLVSQSYALFVGACLDVKNGVIFGPFLFTPFVIFSGFFVQLNNASPYFRWIFHISFLKYGLEGMMLSVFGYDRGKIPCNADYCHYVYPEKFLDEIDMEDAVYAHAVYFLVGLVLFLRTIAYAALFVKIGRKR